MKDKEEIAIGCTVGLCAQVSSSCNTVRWLLSHLHAWLTGRGKERGAEGASGGQQHPKDQR